MASRLHHGCGEPPSFPVTTRINRVGDIDAPRARLSVFISLVRTAGLEPARGCPQGILSLILCKLTKTVVDTATFGAKEYELRDTPGFLLKVTRAGRKIFMVQYRTNAGERRKPAIGRFGELTVEQARAIAQDWLADVRKGKDPSAEKTTARNAPSVKELCAKFIEDYSKPKNRPRTVKSYQGYINRHIIPKLGALKVRQVIRSDVSDVMTRMKKTPVTANRVLSCLRRMFNMAEVWVSVTTAPIRAVTSRVRGEREDAADHRRRNGPAVRLLRARRCEGRGIDGYGLVAKRNAALP